MVDVPSLDHNDFTLALKFTMPDLDLVYSRPIIVGGTGCRWIVAQVDEAGNLSVDFNNHGYFSGINDPAYRIDLGMAIAPNVTYTLVLNVDIAGRTLTVWLNGAKVIRPLPSGLVWEVPAGEPVLLSNDLSRGKAFKGTWDWVFTVNGLLVYDTFVGMAVAAGLWNPGAAHGGRPPAL